MTNKKFVLDSSVFLAQFLNEKNHNQVTVFLENALRNKAKILIPDLFHYEVLSILAKEKIADFDGALDIINDYEITILKTIKLEAKIIKKAKKLTELGNNKSGFPSFYDCVYHALAILNDCDFITEDKRHYEKTKSAGNIKLFKDIENY
jgi:predicted nucleic acid-binding protein